MKFIFHSVFIIILSSISLLQNGALAEPLKADDSDAFLDSPEGYASSDSSPFQNPQFLFQAGPGRRREPEGVPGPSLLESLVHTVSTAVTNFDPSELFEQVTNVGRDVETFVSDMVKDIATKFPDVKEAITRFEKQLRALVQSTSGLREEFNIAATKLGSNPEVVSDELGQLLMGVLDEVKTMFPPPDHAPGHEERERAVRATLEKVENVLVVLGAKYGLNDRVVRKHFKGIKPHLEGVVVTAGDLIEQHPVVAEGILVAAVTLVLPEGGWFLRPLLRVFGFGLQGPVKGTPAAWMQQVFFGRAIPAGNWFAKLQRAGMKGLPLALKNAERIIGGIGADIGMRAGLKNQKERKKRRDSS